MSSSILGPLWVLFNSHNNFAKKKKKDISSPSLSPPILQKRKLRLRKRALLQTRDHLSPKPWPFLSQKLTGLLELTFFLRPFLLQFPIQGKKKVQNGALAEDVLGEEVHNTLNSKIFLKLHIKSSLTLEFCFQLSPIPFSGSLHSRKTLFPSPKTLSFLFG